MGVDDHLEGSSGADVVVRKKDSSYEEDKKSC